MNAGAAARCFDPSRETAAYFARTVRSNALPSKAQVPVAEGERERSVVNEIRRRACAVLVPNNRIERSLGE